MTDNVIRFPVKDKPKTSSADETACKKSDDALLNKRQATVISNLMAKTIVDILARLREKYPKTYFDPEIIISDSGVTTNLYAVIRQMIQLGEDMDPSPSGPIDDHKKP